MSNDAIRRELARRELARRSLDNYIKYMDDSFIFERFQLQLCEYLDAFLEACERGGSPRLMIFAPPRAGKSEVISRNFPTYVIGKHPNWEIISASATDNLASDFGLWAKNRMNTEKYRDLFPEFQADPARNSVQNVRTTTNGGYLAVGVGTQIVGKGARVGILDDPVAGIKEALSETERESLFIWYLANMQSRLADGGGMLIMHQRWHTDDLASRLIAASKRDPNASKWTVLSYPAIAIEDGADPLKRKAGEPLTPNRWPKESLIRIKADLSVNGRSRDWFAMYQQTPIVDGGAFFKKNHIKYWKTLPDELSYLICADYAVTRSPRGDKTAIFCMGVDYDSNIYIMDTYHWGRWDSLEIVEKTVDLAKKYDARTLATETGPIQGALNPLFDAEMRDQNHYMTIDKTARRGSKIVVAHALRGMMEAGKVYFPDTPETIDSLIPNLLSFSDDTDGDDDAVDALSLGALCVERIGKPLPPETTPAPSWKKEGEIYSEDIWKKVDGKKSGVPKLGDRW